MPNHSRKGSTSPNALRKSLTLMPSKMGIPQYVPDVEPTGSGFSLDSYGGPGYDSDNYGSDDYGDGDGGQPTHTQCVLTPPPILGQDRNCASDLEKAGCMYPGCKEILGHQAWMHDAGKVDTELAARADRDRFERFYSRVLVDKNPCYLECPSIQCTGETIVYTTDKAISKAQYQQGM
eukprot:gene2580-3292_t